MRSLIWICLLVVLLGGCAQGSVSVPIMPTVPIAPRPAGETETTPNPESAAKTPELAEVPDPMSQGVWQLVFRDEFYTPQLDAVKWRTDYRWGRVNPPELQYYAADAFDVRNGLLRIKAEKRSMERRAYTSGLISSSDHFKFTYGYAEIKAQVPAGKGLWPAFWLLADNDQATGEIDVMEILGDQPQRVHMTVHYDDSSGREQEDGGSFDGPDLSKAYHTFAVDWSPNVIVWYVDDIERFRVTHDVPSQPMYVLANLAVGGKWPGDPDSTTRFPAYLDIDYIRVYQR